MIQEQVTLPPLDFFKNEVFHEDNLKIVERENQRYKSLTWGERRRLQRDIRQLHKRLRREGYNELIIERAALYDEYQAIKQLYVSKSFINRDALRQAVTRARTCYERGRAVHKRLGELAEDYARYTHYVSWLEYERKNRKQLKADEKREKEIRVGMRQESDWLESLLLDVFRKTPGCHHIMSKDGKEITRIPRFERITIEPDAHYFWLEASKEHPLRRFMPWLGYKWMLPYGVVIPNLTDEKTLANMKAATKRQVDVIWSTAGQMMFRVSRLDSPDAMPKLVLWRDTRAFYPQNRNAKLPYCIGAGESRKLMWFDFASDPHILIAGKSQSGKSNLVNGIIATLVSTHTPDELRIVLIDQKGGLEFTHWEDLPHVLWQMAKTVEQVKPYFDRLVNIMRKRMELLEKIKAKDIAAYNLKVDQEYRLPRLLVIFDEMNSIVGMGALTEEIHNLLMLLVSQGRAVGLHVIASTQHPEVKVIPGRIKTNMSVRMSGAMPSITASQIVIDAPDAARLPNVPGRFVAVVGLKTLVIQVPYIEDHDIAQVVSGAKVAFTDVSEELKELSAAPKLTVWDEERTIKAALEWLDGHLGGEKLHKLLGDESPGERHMRTMCKRVIDRVTATGGVMQWQGDEYKLIKVKGGGRKLVKTDKASVASSPELLSEQKSEILSGLIDAQVFAADGALDERRSCGVYRDSKSGLAIRLLLRLKYERMSLDAARLIADELAGYLVHQLVLANWQPTIITAVPSTEEKVLERGFNQAELIAHAVSQRTSSVGYANMIDRARQTKPQAKLKKKVDRTENLQGAFVVHRDLSGAGVLVIDDIATTGTTLQECATALKRAGAEKVWALTLASGRRWENEGDEPPADQHAMEVEPILEVTP